MRKLIIAICAVLAGIAICTAFFITTAIPKTSASSSYKVYVFDDGAAQINVDSINNVMQLHEDAELDGTDLKAGTLIVLGDGSEIYYEYPRKDVLK